MQYASRAQGNVPDKCDICNQPATLTDATTLSDQAARTNEAFLTDDGSGGDDGIRPNMGVIGYHRICIDLCRRMDSGLECRRRRDDGSHARVTRIGLVTHKHGACCEVSVFCT